MVTLGSKRVGQSSGATPGPLSATCTTAPAGALGPHVDVTVLLVAGLDGLGGVEEQVQEHLPEARGRALEGGQVVGNLEHRARAAAQGEGRQHDRAVDDALQIDELAAHRLLRGQRMQRLAHVEDRVHAGGGVPEGDVGLAALAVGDGAACHFDARQDRAGRVRISWPEPRREPRHRGHALRDHQAVDGALELARLALRLLRGGGRSRGPAPHDPPAA